ncbi:MAG: histone deacetylase, partial [Rubrobacteraceae bacterium]
PPGHHAGAGYAMGFCLLNHAAVAAEYARSRGTERVAILDWDVHHGNGTQDIFYASGDVLYLSAHQSPFYPGTGAAGEVGEGAGRGYTVNAPLPRASGEQDYESAFEDVFLPVLREFRPGLVIISAGFDAHAADPIGGMRLTSESFGRFAAWISSLTQEIDAAPPALVLEGGYDLEALSESVAATITGVEDETRGHELDSGGKRLADSAAAHEARKALAPFWESLQ